MRFDDNEAPVMIIRPINPDGSFGKPIRLEKPQVINWWEESEPIPDFQDNLMYMSLSFPIETISGTLKLYLPQKMSRKKFKKWLMSRGFNRYFAEWFCKAVKSFHGKKSYRSLYLYGQFASTPQALFNELFDALFPITKNKESEE